MEQSRRPRRLVGLIAGVAMTLLAAACSGDAGRATAGGLESIRRVIPAGERVTVEVLNGSNRRGGARIATRVLRRAGFDVMTYGTAPEPSDSTWILVRRGGDAPAVSARTVLGTGTVRAAPDTTVRVDLTIILGPDWHPPAGIIP